MNNPDDLKLLYRRDSGIAHLLASPSKPDVERPKPSPAGASLYVGSETSEIVFIDSVDSTRPRKFIEQHFNWVRHSSINWKKMLAVSEVNAAGTSFTSPAASILFHFYVSNNRMLSSADQGLYIRINSQTEQDINSLLEKYEFDDPNRLRIILLAHPSAITLLLEARSHLARIFGEDTFVHLQLVPEDEDGAGVALFANVYTQDDPLVAFEKMSRFDEEWWLDASERSDGVLNFSVEFV